MGKVSSTLPKLENSMPSLFIDTERLRDLNSGLGQVCLHLGNELVRQQPAGWKVTFLVPNGQSGVFGYGKDNVRHSDMPVNYIEASWHRKLWIPGTYDVWHCLHQDSAYLPRDKAKMILTIHDLNFLERVDYSEAKKARKRATLQRKVDRADALTAISAYTASVVNQQLSLPDTKPVQVIANGVAVSERDLRADGSRPAFLEGDDHPYFLFVGVLHPKKNVHTLLPLLEAFPDYRLILAGPDGHPYAQHIREQAQKLGIADRLLMPGAVDEPTKLWLYGHCEAFLFPSISEGFGLPVAEAMAFGKPVFISNLTSLPEIGGKEAYYFEDFEPENMAKVLHDGLHDFGQNSLRQERMRKRAASFNWPDVAGEYWTLYEGLVKRS
jgi:glycosyltransferase involved in cell wall biosynthesis